MMDIDAIYEVATGQVESPSIEVEIEGTIQEAEGRDARMLSLGILIGLRIRDDEGSVSITDNTKQSAEG